MFSPFWPGRQLLWVHVRIPVHQTSSENECSLIRKKLLQRGEHSHLFESTSFRKNHKQFWHKHHSWKWINWLEVIYCSSISTDVSDSYLKYVFLLWLWIWHSSVAVLLCFCVCDLIFAFVMSLSVPYVSFLGASGGSCFVSVTVPEYLHYTFFYILLLAAKKSVYVVKKKVVSITSEMESYHFTCDWYDLYFHSSLWTTLVFFIVSDVGVTATSDFWTSLTSLFLN